MRAGAAVTTMTDEGPLARAAWPLRALLAGATVACLAVPGWDAFLRASLFLVLAGGLVGAWLVSRLPTRDGARLHVAEAGWSLMFLLHFLGHAADLYADWALYDKLLHATGGVVAALAGVVLARGTGWFFDGGTERAFRVFWVAFSVAVVSGAAVELVEYGADVAFGTGTQEHPVLAPLDDTMTDLLAETATGAATGAWLAWRAARPEGEPARRRRAVRRAG